MDNRNGIGYGFYKIKLSLKLIDFRKGYVVIENKLVLKSKHET